MITSKQLVITLKERFNFPIGNKSLTAIVPKCIMHTTTKNKASFLRGVIDGDGCIKSNGCISIYSGSKKFIEDLNKILEALQIKSKNILQSRNVFLIYISNKKDIERLYEKCYKNSVYCYPRKLMSLERIIFKNE